MAAATLSQPSAAHGGPSRPHDGRLRLRHSAPLPVLHSVPPSPPVPSIPRAPPSPSTSVASIPDQSSHARPSRPHHARPHPHQHQTPVPAIRVPSTPSTPSSASSRSSTLSSSPSPSTLSADAARDADVDRQSDVALLLSLSLALLTSAASADCVAFRARLPSSTASRYVVAWGGADSGGAEMVLRARGRRGAGRWAVVAGRGPREKYVVRAEDADNFRYQVLVHSFLRASVKRVIVLGVAGRDRGVPVLVIVGDALGKRFSIETIHDGRQVARVKRVVRVQSVETPKLGRRVNMEVAEWEIKVHVGYDAALVTVLTCLLEQWVRELEAPVVFRSERKSTTSTSGGSSTRSSTGRSSARSSTGRSSALACLPSAAGLPSSVRVLRRLSFDRVSVASLGKIFTRNGVSRCRSEVVPSSRTLDDTRK